MSKKMINFIDITDKKLLDEKYSSMIFNQKNECHKKENKFSIKLYIKSVCLIVTKAYVIDSNEVKITYIIFSKEYLEELNKIDNLSDIAKLQSDKNKKLSKFYIINKVKSIFKEKFLKADVTRKMKKVEKYIKSNTDIYLNENIYSSNILGTSINISSIEHIRVKIHENIEKNILLNALNLAKWDYSIIIDMKNNLYFNSLKYLMNTLKDSNINNNNESIFMKVLLCFRYEIDTKVVQQYIEKYKIVDILYDKSTIDFEYINKIKELNKKYGTTIKIISTNDLTNYQIYVIFNTVDFSYYVLNKEAIVLDLTKIEEDIYSKEYKYYSTYLQNLDSDLKYIFANNKMLFNKLEIASKIKSNSKTIN